jgi:hypothetical protein
MEEIHCYTTQTPAGLKGPLLLGGSFMFRWLSLVTCQLLRQQPAAGIDDEPPTAESE